MAKSINKRCFGAPLRFCVAISAVAVLKSLTNSIVLAYVALLLMIICVLSVRTEQIFPVLLFLVPWGGVLKVAPGSNSFTSLIIPLVVIRVVLSQRRLKIDKTGILLVMALLCVTFLSNLIANNLPGTEALRFFISLLYVLILISNEEMVPQKQETVYMFIIGLITAFFAGMILHDVPHMRSYFKDANVLGQAGLTSRFTSLSFDPNYNALQISMGMASMIFVIALKPHYQIRDIVILFVLIGMGLFSISKMFLFILITVLFISAISYLGDEKGVAQKTKLAILAVVMVVFIFSNDFFAEQINAYIYRLEGVTDFAGLSTGRSTILLSYKEYLFQNPLTLLMGSGFRSDAKLGKVAHNTFVQSIFQVGIVGTVILMGYFLLCFRKIKYGKFKIRSVFLAPFVVLLIGTVSLDLLFYQEFIYYVFLACLLFGKPSTKKVADKNSFKGA